MHINLFGHKEGKWSKVLWTTTVWNWFSKSFYWKTILLIGLIIILKNWEVFELDSLRQKFIFCNTAWLSKERMLKEKLDFVMFSEGFVNNLAWLLRTSELTLSVVLNLLIARMLS